MGAKERIAAYVCINADGPEKLKMARIDKAKNPCCFRLEHQYVLYFSQKNARSDVVTFKKCFDENFLPHVCRRKSKPVILLIENCGPFGSDISDPKGQVQLQALRPNCTAVNQPKDQGVIEA